MATTTAPWLLMRTDTMKNTNAMVQGALVTRSVSMAFIWSI